MKQDTLEGKAKTKNGVKRLCFSIVCILLEVIFIIVMVTRLNEYAEVVNLFTRIFSGILVLGLYASDKTSSMKMPWVILILIFPVMGVGLYLLIGLNGGTHKMRERYAEIDKILLPMLPDNQESLNRIKEKIPKAGNIADYIYRNSQYPIYQNTGIVYYDEAVKGLEAQLEDLSKAQKFIFMEYHAIEDAEAWHKIQSVLEERVKAGVEVRVFYDDMGSIGFITTDFVKKMERIGIHCRVFNPFMPGLNLFLNNSCFAITYIFLFIEDTTSGGSQFDLWLAHNIYAPSFGTFSFPTIFKLKYIIHARCTKKTDIFLIIFTSLFY